MKKHFYRISFLCKGTREAIIKEAMKLYKHPLFCGMAVMVKGEGKRIAVVNEKEKVGTQRLKNIIKTI